jgi:hypothetical protein
MSLLLSDRSNPFAPIEPLPSSLDLDRLLPLRADPLPILTSYQPIKIYEQDFARISSLLDLVFTIFSYAHNQGLTVQ